MIYCRYDLVLEMGNILIIMIIVIKSPHDNDIVLVLSYYHHNSDAFWTINYVLGLFTQTNKDSDLNKAHS